MTNRLILLGRLTRDPEAKTFSNGGKVAKFSLATTGERKKDQATGKWQEVPCFIDCEVFNRGEFGKLADTAEQYLTKGQQVYAEAHLKTESWTSADGQKRSKLVAVVDSFQMVGSKSQGHEQSTYARNAMKQEPANEPQYAPDEDPSTVPF
jgi:single-strand DNA-binding protein